MGRMERILVAGGAGFIGGHLCRRLLSEGYSVLCVDNLLTGRADNVRDLKMDKNFALLKRDVTNPIQQPGAVDAVIHLASAASPKDFLRLGPEIMRAGALGTWNMLELARKREVTFLLASTSEVYGDPEVHPQPEEYWGHVNPIGPRSAYDESKRYAETLTTLYHRQHGLDVRIARIFNTFGPGMRLDDGRVVLSFIRQALVGEPLTVYGDGKQTRSFCYVSDMVEGLLRLMKSPETTPVNLGNPREITILDLTNILEELLGHPLRRTHLPLPEDDPRRRCPDISKARRVLGWEPRVPLEEGLKWTIDYHAGKGT